MIQRALWVIVNMQKKEEQELRDGKPRRGEKSYTLVMKTDATKYSKVLKAVRSDAKFTDLRADVLSTRTGMA